MNLEVGKFRHHMKGMVSLPCLLNLLLLLASISLQYCSAVETISVTNPLHHPNFIVSSGGTFKLGFFSPQNTTNRYVGIMYNVPKISVVWVANRDKPLNDLSGALTILEDGNLVVLNGMKEVLWSSNAQNPVPNSTAQLLEDGNLVLRDNSNGKSVWESFLIPTDSFLAGMRVGQGDNGTIQLTTWSSPSNPSIGNFTFGILPLPIPEMFLWNRGAISWRSGPWDGKVFIGSPGMNPIYGSMVLVESDNAREAYLTYDSFNETRLYHYKFSYSGDFQQFALNEKGDWETTVLLQPIECNVYGKCGPNGMCDPEGSPICSCLEGFEPRDREQWTRGNWSSGCVRKSRLQCQRNDSAGQQGKVDGFLKLKNVKVPDQSIIVQALEQECENECLKKCSCSAYIFVVGIGCLYWEDDTMFDIEQFSMRGSDLYLRVAHSELDNTGSKQKKKAIIATTFTAGCLFLALSLYILWNWWIKHRGIQMLGESPEKSKLEELPLYSYETLATASDHFHVKNKLGQGGFGSVYKGKLLDGQEIAVKRLSISSSQGIKEFMNEVTLISKLQHRNLVRFLGCCIEREENMLVYEYLPNKSLDAYIFDSEKQDFLDWNRRSIIIEGIGRGLLYLHRDSRLRIIHRDLKPSNILVDEEMNPKISDFGLARIFGGKQDQANTNRVVGTYGYMAPEYAMGGKFSEKSDVYSFGVLLLEIVSGRRNTSFYHDKEYLSLLGYAWKLWDENKVVNMAFTKIIVPNVAMEIHRCVQVGLLCVQDSPNDRPSMSNVLWMLNCKIRELPLPKLPVYTATFPLPGEADYPQRALSNNYVSFTEVQGR